MPDGTSQDIKRGRKFDQVIDGARDIFMSVGFEGASVDDIARAAGVSKATLYSYFPDKRLLFLEVARQDCVRHADLAMASVDFDGPVREVLTAVGAQMVDFITSEFGQKVFRLCVAESARFPQLGREFYESGPLLVRGKLIAFFERAIVRGELRIDDLPLAADQFHELCKADLFPRLVFALDREFSAAQKRRVVDGAVETFLARYGVA
ncbi:TetR/AcrR family transcriptional regulator [Histidinibacterium lentulum]|uniref:TetR/AcrR family transcriptional regulator n=1 Tax=Histidinibacterium lentulum TaxID=2480588 RepID=A0A3N2R1I7_9RHOB|nr:TetR/AcrR family transcriptional regulator [Histidinibacterium lentulum]ROU01208.1 TetR/AcrR family transcriptional regulator [Histidinibacterium lentulum]